MQGDFFIYSFTLTVVCNSFLMQLYDELKANEEIYKRKKIFLWNLETKYKKTFFWECQWIQIFLKYSVFQSTRNFKKNFEDIYWRYIWQIITLHKKHFFPTFPRYSEAIRIFRKSWEKCLLSTTFIMMVVEM